MTRRKMECLRSSGKTFLNGSAFIISSNVRDLYN
jgi:hypothetical protein